MPSIIQKRSSVLRHSIRVLKNWDGFQGVRSESIIALRLLMLTAPYSAAELVAFPAPDVILAHNPAMVAALKQATDTIPIVFVPASDPVILRVVTGLSHPSGNVTGFVLFEPSLAGKWLQFLTEVSRG